MAVMHIVIKIFYNKSVHENAAHYYQLAKESREKIVGLEKAMEETRKEMAEAKAAGADKKGAGIRVKRQKEWFEKFHSAHTASGMLMIGGRSAQQNDQLVSKHMEDDDLFFHADIQGGAVFVLKCGINATEEDLKEAAQMAACYSNAWKNANAGVDVYCVKKSQLTKNVSGGFVPSGAFAILGERRWFRGTPLSLRIGTKEGSVRIVPDISKITLDSQLVLVPSHAGKDKGGLAKPLAKRFGVHPDDLLELLPNGKSKTVQK